MAVREARDAYFRENGFSLAAYAAPYAVMSLFGLAVRIPNPAARKRNIRYHDLHHVLTGFGTDLAGEGEVAAWQFRAGLPASLFLRALITSGLLLGALVAPRRVLAAWRAGRGCRSLFKQLPPYEELLEKTVGELRELVGVPACGIATAPRRRHGRAPAL
jgi:hypothetical protein